jgi:molecular chaperone DnaJ
MATKKTHYEVLGVRSNASEAEIRNAYRALARTLHPDVVGSAASGSRSMSDVNHAWSVLSDLSSRRVYDQSLGTHSRVNHATETSFRAAYVVNQSEPARFPWRAMLVMAAVGTVLVLVLHAFSSPPTPGAPDQLLSSGSCVDISTELVASEVSCEGPHDAVVNQLIATDRTCPTGTEPYRDRQGMGIACVVKE